MHCWLEPLGFYCIRFWPMQSCPKSIETRLQSIFPDAMLSGTSRTAWHRAFTCTMLSQEHQGEFGQDYFLCNVVWSFSENIV